MDDLKSPRGRFSVLKNLADRNARNTYDYDRVAQRTRLRTEIIICSGRVVFGHLVIEVRTGSAPGNDERIPQAISTRNRELRTKRSRRTLLLGNFLFLNLRALCYVLRGNTGLKNYPMNRST